jgi:hypothetical protein
MKGFCRYELFPLFIAVLQGRVESGAYVGSEVFFSCGYAEN